MTERRGLLACSLVGALVCTAAVFADNGLSDRSTGLVDAGGINKDASVLVMKDLDVKVFPSSTGILVHDPIVSGTGANGVEIKAANLGNGRFFLRTSGEKATLSVGYGDIEGSVDVAIGRMTSAEVNVYIGTDGTLSAKVIDRSGLGGLQDALGAAETALGSGGGNTCATAEAISGAGEFSFDNSAATTDGLGDPLCDKFGSDQVENDVWFCWTSDCDGDVTVQTCGLTAVDTKIAVYDGCGCPTGPALDCNDDTCGLQSSVSFAAAPGNTYLIRIGTFPGAAGGTGSFSIGGTGCGGGGGPGNPACNASAGDCNVPNGTPGCNDEDCCNTVCDCDPFCCDVEWDGFCVGPNGSTPGCSVVELGLTCDGGGGGGDTINANLCADAVAIEGEGDFAFDNSAATTDGLGDPLCDSFGSDQIENDVWACWTAPSDCLATVQTCGLTGVDTKIAVYDGCAPGPILGCNDDTCGLQSLVQFDAVAGNTYKIRIGTFPGATGGTGSINIACSGGGDLPCQLSDCQNFATDNASQSNDAAFTSADDFNAGASGDITEICWWGAYLPSINTDAFVVTYYDDAGGVPGNVIGGPFTQPFTLNVTGPEDTGALVAGVAPIWEYSATHAAVAVTAGNCYWIEVKNNPDGGATWFWEWSFDGNLRVAVDDLAASPGYDLGDIQNGNDFAWCLNLPLGIPGDSGDPCGVPASGNDLCANAEAISGQGSFPFDNTSAGTDGVGDLLCDAFGSDQVDNDVWFCWTADCTGSVVFETCGGTGVDTKIAAYDGCGCPTGNGILACNDDSCGLQSAVQFDVIAGNQYLLRIGTFPGASGGVGTFSMTCVAVPANDLCADAIEVGVPSTTAGTTEFASFDDVGTCGTSNTAPGVWYSVAGTGNTMTASFCPQFASDCCFSNGSPGCDDQACQDAVCAADSFCCDVTWDGICADLASDLCGDLCMVSSGGDADYDSKISVFCGSCDDLTCVDGNDDTCGLQSEVTWCSQAGATYLILVHGFGSATGNFSLDISDDGASCVPDVQCIPLGACCICDESNQATCLDNLTQADCENMDGVYVGDGTSCQGGFIGYSVMAGGAFDDISGTGTEAPTASNTDDGGDVLPLGFSFNFFGNSYSEIGVASNGYLTFGPDLSDFTNDPIPDPIDPNDLIAPYWDDWSPNQSGTVVYQQGAGSFTAQWTDVPHFDGSGPSTFQAVLTDDGCIEFRYGSLSPNSPTVGIENEDGTDGIDSTGSEPGSIRYCPQFTDPVDCTEFVSCVTVVPVDIKPGSCPNSWNRNSNGVLPVAVLGTMDFDASSIDPSTITISRADGVGGSTGPNFGPPGPSPVIDDVATPYDGEGCDCHDLNGDGIDDLVLHFRTQDVVAALGMDEFAGGSLVELVINGSTNDGAPITGSDCVRLVPPGSAPAALTIQNLPGRFTNVTPIDDALDGGGFGNFVRAFYFGTEVTLTAEQYEDLTFVGWRVNGEIVSNDTSLDITMMQSETVEVVYNRHGQLGTGTTSPNSLGSGR